MPPQQTPLPRAAEPKLGRNFDPWNSVGAGHQRAETKGPGGWRESRALKMNSQFSAGHTGGARLADTAGAGAEHFDERLGAIVTPAVKARAKLNVMDMLRKPGTMKEASTVSSGQRDGPSQGHTEQARSQQPRDESDEGQWKHDEDEALPGSMEGNTELSKEMDTDPTKRKILDGVTVYVNGSTHPLVSDHRLKHILAEHGARVALHLPRRQVTHVILGRPAGSGTQAGAGGGLAGGKLEREIRRVGGKGIRFVGVEWVLESVKAGRRLPEARFTNMSVAPRAQRSVIGLFPPRDRQAPGPT